jgi:hypothetical protein
LRQGIWMISFTAAQGIRVLGVAGHRRRPRRRFAT